MKRNVTTGREEFSAKVAHRIAQKAMYVCSNPTCLRMTGYATTEGRPRTIAEAAHIVAAGKKGPRRLLGDKTDQIHTEGNGIWLCSICHKKIDADPTAYPTDVLKRWKTDHQTVIRGIVGKDLETALLDLRDHKRYHNESREFLSFIESKRVLYEGLDHEYPPRVLESLELIRERVVQTRAKVSPESPVFTALNKIQAAVNTFLREIGPQTDLRTLRCNSGDPRWRRFANKLNQLRSGIVIILKVVAGDAGYRLTWIND